MTIWVHLHELKIDVSINNNPVLFSEAIKEDNYAKELYVMKEELKSMNDNEVNHIVELPKGSKRVGCKWIFKTKLNSNGNIKWYKARFVVKGYTQKDKEISISKKWLIKNYYGFSSLLWFRDSSNRCENYLSKNENWEEVSWIN